MEVQKGQRLTIIGGSLTKIDEHDIFNRAKRNRDRDGQRSGYGQR